MVLRGKEESRVFGGVATDRLPAQAPGVTPYLTKADSIRILREWCQERGYDKTSRVTL